MYQRDVQINLPPNHVYDIDGDFIQEVHLCVWGGVRAGVGLRLRLLHLECVGIKPVPRKEGVEALYIIIKACRMTSTPPLLFRGP